jgi:hypothetical protein
VGERDGRRALPLRRAEGAHRVRAVAVHGQRDEVVPSRTRRSSPVSMPGFCASVATSSRTIPSRNTGEKHTHPRPSRARRPPQLLRDRLRYSPPAANTASGANAKFHPLYRRCCWRSSRSDRPDGGARHDGSGDEPGTAEARAGTKSRLVGEPHRRCRGTHRDVVCQHLGSGLGNLACPATSNRGYCGRTPNRAP